MQLEDAPPHFATEACDVCGESVLSPYARMRNGARLCIRCDERRDALGRR